jgi:mRNA interferase HigB
LKCWFREASKARWRDPHEIKGRYPSASILPGGRVVFNIGGNKYRLVAAVRYDFGLVYVRFIGTHAEYDCIDAGSV